MTTCVGFFFHTVLFDGELEGGMFTWAWAVYTMKMVVLCVCCFLFSFVFHSLFCFLFFVQTGRFAQDRDRFWMYSCLSEDMMAKAIKLCLGGEMEPLCSHFLWCPHNRLLSQTGDYSTGEEGSSMFWPLYPQQEFSLKERIVKRVLWFMTTCRFASPLAFRQLHASFRGLIPPTPTPCTQHIDYYYGEKWSWSWEVCKPHFDGTSGNDDDDSEDSVCVCLNYRSNWQCLCVSLLQK